MDDIPIIKVTTPSDRSYTPSPKNVKRKKGKKPKLEKIIIIDYSSGHIEHEYQSKCTLCCCTVL